MLVTSASSCQAEELLQIGVEKRSLWIKLGSHPQEVVPSRVRRTKLFGAWEMNWLAYNYGHDVKLPNATEGPVPFLMYPQAETAEGRKDSLEPTSFKYQITAREVKA